MRYWVAVTGTIGDPLPDEWRVRWAKWKEGVLALCVRVTFAHANSASRTP